jgi:hypothetical protein
VGSAFRGRRRLSGRALNHPQNDDELTEEDRPAVTASLKYFHRRGEGIQFDQVVDDLGFTMDLDPQQ